MRRMVLSACSSLLPQALPKLSLSSSPLSTSLCAPSQHSMAATAACFCGQPALVRAHKLVRGKWDTNLAGAGGGGSRSSSLLSLPLPSLVAKPLQHSPLLPHRWLYCPFRPHSIYDGELLGLRSPPRAGEVPDAEGEGGGAAGEETSALGFVNWDPSLVNTVSLIGRIISLSTLQNIGTEGKYVLNLSLAVKSRRDHKDDVPDTDTYKVTAFGDLALRVNEEAEQNGLGEGSQVYVKGKLQLYDYKGEENASVIAKDVFRVGSKQWPGQAQASPHSDSSPLEPSSFQQDPFSFASSQSSSHDAFLLEEPQHHAEQQFLSREGGQHAEASQEAVPQTDEEFWGELYQYPERYWDNRRTKTNPRAPDFKRRSQPDKALWIDNRRTPQWAKDLYTLTD